ncbi:MAG: DEAD/DEAH box helicase family protein, partial [Candidatus Izemoplasmatales bacterium]
MIAQVLVDVKSKNVNKTYDYLVPEAFMGFLELGARVVVPFGNRAVMGFVLGFLEDSEYSNKLKSISKVLDIESFLTSELIDIAKDLSVRTNTILIRVLETILPSALKVIYKPKIMVVNFENLSEDLKPIFEYQSQVLLENIDEKHYKLINREIKNDNLTQIYEIRDLNKNLTKKFVRKTSKEFDKISDKQRLVLNYLEAQKGKEELLKILLKKTNVTDSVVKTLEKHAYVETYVKEVYRKVETLNEVTDKIIELNIVQEPIFEKIICKKNTNSKFLLHGVTGSGKTEIYLKTIEDVINDGKNVLLLVPEISLTPMMISRFKSRFKSLVAALHSGLSSGEKYD